MFLSVSCLLAAITVAQVPTPEPVKLPNGGTLQEVSFERHVAPILVKFGCNAGSCHGSAQGRGGFKLSLFGYNPDSDHLAMTKEAQGRRIALADPDKSLVLLKASGQVEHGGGQRFAKDSWTYQVLRAWIAAGASRGAGKGAVKQLTVEPAETFLQRPGERAAVKVQVEFADGTRENLSPFSDFRVLDDSIVRVSAVGEASGLHAGESPVIVTYRGQVATARILVASPIPQGFAYPKIPEENYIDREVFAKLRRLNIVPSDLADDAEFLRRVTVDTIGCLPSPTEIRKFLADKRPDKRQHKIDELLADPLHAALWATRFCDITGCNIVAMESDLQSKRAWMWHDWFKSRLADDMSYDKIVHGVLCATSREGRDNLTWIDDEARLIQKMKEGFPTRYDGRKSLELFWRRFDGKEFFPLEQMAERTATAFMGVRIQCAQCHKHPFDRWTQADYRAYANVFSRVRFDIQPEVRDLVTKLVAERREKGATDTPPIPRMTELYVGSNSGRQLLHPMTKDFLEARALGGPSMEGPGDPRERLFQWLVQKDNPYFARALVNRLWGHYLGRGLVDPVDDFSIGNPASNEHLLDVLAKDFVEHGFRIRRLERAILTSRVYQLSFRPNESNKHDRILHSHTRPRPMLAEVVVDVLNSALGTVEDLGPDAPPGSRAIEIGSNFVKPAHLGQMFRLFGRPVRNAACDCERPRDVAINQTLFLMTDPILLKKMEGGRLKSLLASKSTDAQVVEELFLATLSRLPEVAESKAALEAVGRAADRRAGFVNVLWALINTREFILNH
jgi:hypothetical protein